MARTPKPPTPGGGFSPSDQEIRRVERLATALENYARQQNASLPLNKKVTEAFRLMAREIREVEVPNTSMIKSIAGNAGIFREVSDAVDAFTSAQGKGVKQAEDGIKASIQHAAAIALDTHEAEKAERSFHKLGSATAGLSAAVGLNITKVSDLGKGFQGVAGQADGLFRSLGHGASIGGALVSVFGSLGSSLVKWAGAKVAGAAGGAGLEATATTLAGAGASALVGLGIGAGVYGVKASDEYRRISELLAPQLETRLGLASGAAQGIYVPIHNLVSEFRTTIEEAREFHLALAEAGMEYGEIVKHSYDLYAMQLMTGISATSMATTMKSLERNFFLTSDESKKLLSTVIATGAALENWTPGEFLQHIQQLLDNFKDLNISIDDVRRTYTAFIRTPGEGAGSTIMEKVFGVKGITPETAGRFFTGLVEVYSKGDMNQRLLSALGFRRAGEAVPGESILGTMARMDEMVANKEMGPHAYGIYGLAEIMTRMRAGKGDAERQQLFAQFAPQFLPFLSAIPRPQLATLLSNAEAQPGGLAEGLFKALQPYVDAEKAKTDADLKKQEAALNLAEDAQKAQLGTLQSLLRIEELQRLQLGHSLGIGGDLERKAREEEATKLIFEGSLGEGGKLTERSVDTLETVFPLSLGLDKRGALNAANIYRTLSGSTPIEALEKISGSSNFNDLWTDIRNVSEPSLLINKFLASAPESIQNMALKAMTEKNIERFTKYEGFDFLGDEYKDYFILAEKLDTLVETLREGLISGTSPISSSLQDAVSILESMRTQRSSPSTINGDDIFTTPPQSPPQKRSPPIFIIR